MTKFGPRCAALGIALAISTAAAHPESAIELATLDALIAKTPNNPALYLHRAAHRADQAEWAGAESDLRRAAQLAPDSPRVMLALGRLCLARDRLPEARRQLDAVLARTPRDAEALVLRARTLARLGAAEAALADYSAAIRLLAAPSPDLFLERAQLPLDPRTALAGIDEGLARLGPVVPLLERATALELHLGHTDAALDRLDALARLAERKETWLKRRGDILAAAGRTAEARAAYAAALAAINALPVWLRTSPDTDRLAVELTRLTANSS